MRIRSFFCATLILLFSFSASAVDLRSFLKTCAYGVLIGAGAGVVSLAVTDKPGDNLNNIARGASLGLYGGIAYGVYQMNQPEIKSYQEPGLGLSPVFDKGKVDGWKISGTVASF